MHRVCLVGIGGDGRDYDEERSDKARDKGDEAHLQRCRTRLSAEQRSELLSNLDP